MTVNSTDGMFSMYVLSDDERRYIYRGGRIRASWRMRELVSYLRRPSARSMVEELQEVVDRAGLSGTATICTSCYNEFLANFPENTEMLVREMCPQCSNEAYVRTPRGEVIERHTAQYANDTGEYETVVHARSNWYRAQNGDWYAHHTNVPDDADFFDEENETTTDDYGRLEYSTNVLTLCPWPESSDKSALLFGVELEMEGRGQSPRGIVSALPVFDGVEAKERRFIIKADGSLDDGGVELVTMPFTLDYHREKFGWDKLLSPALQEVAKSGSGTSHCGIHVHINKAALSALQIGKMLVFANSSSLSSYIDIIAQRSQGDYCSRSRKKISDGKHNGDSRYDILNVNPRTVEVRMFKGNLRADRVMKNIEFCHAVAVYCKEASAATIEVWTVFALWLIKRRGQYPNLCKFLHEKGVYEFQQLKFTTKKAA